MRKMGKAARFGIWLFVSTAALLFAQAVYFDRVVRRPAAFSGRTDAVVVFTGDLNRLRFAIQLARRVGARYLIVTRERMPVVNWLALEASGLPGVEVRVDEGYATTTDSNARYAAWELKQAGIKDAVLVTSWYHMPRSYFLLRFYTVFSGIQLRYSASEAAPKAFWSHHYLQLEMFKFWGSLWRVVLHAFGVEDWPRNKAGLRKKTENGRW